jgi:hypothetical protein
MCDYSLQHVASRPAKTEDELVVTKFNNSITRGFAAVGEPHVAVCLLPGTEIAFDANVEIEPSFGIGILPNKKTFQRLARFRQINTDKPTTHHDALEFPDGQVVLLTKVSVQPYCNCQPLRAPRRKRKSRGELLSSHSWTNHNRAFP